jgi:hypothetical protein
MIDGYATVKVLLRGGVFACNQFSIDCEINSKEQLTIYNY